MLEIGNALSKQKFRAAAIELLEALETDPSIEVVLLTNSWQGDKLAELLTAQAFWGVRAKKFDAAHPPLLTKMSSKLAQIPDSLVSFLAESDVSREAQ